MARRAPSSFRTLAEVEQQGRAALGPAVRGYVEGGAAEETTLRENRAAFDRWTLLPRVLEEAEEIDLSTTLLGTKVAAPFFLAPTAYQRKIHPAGERGMARAAAKAGILAVFSTLSSDPLEAIAAAEPAGPRWFQLYAQPDPEATLALARRAESAGFSAIVLTADTPLLGSRDRQGQSGFAIASPVPTGNGPHVVSPPRPFTGKGPRYRWASPNRPSWWLLGQIHATTRVPLVVKGILTPVDARLAVERGARAIVVSNHGGRQLDRVPAALDALPAIVEAVGNRAEVYVDGGARRGSDILIALALGARAVGLGRPALWALAAGGEAGVERFLELLSAELATALALLGRRSVAGVDRSAVAPGPPPSSRYSP
jgi:4-hydroxymandelate oxidase